MQESQLTEEIKLTMKGLYLNPLTISFKNDDEKIIARFIGTCIFGLYEQGVNHFMRDKWGTKPPITNMKLYKDTKALGAMLSALYDLCKECYFIASKSYFSSIQTSGVDWFGQCIRDLIYIEISDTLNPKESTRPKLASLEVKRERLRQLKDVDSLFDKNIFNVYNPYLKFENCEALYLLIEISQKLAGVTPGFDKKYWQPFVNAYGQAITEIEKKYINVQFGSDDQGIYTKAPLKGSRNHTKKYLCKR